jgi:lysozyme
VPAFLAVLSIVQDPAKYGINFKPSMPLSWETTSVTAATDLSVIAQCAGTTLENIQDLNPELRRGTTPGTGETYTLRIPVGSGDTFAQRYASLPPEQLLTWKRHVVGRGETLSTISRVYGSSVGSIMAANNLKGSSVAVGSTLVIPQGAAAEAVPASVLASRAPNFDGDLASSAQSRRTHRVRPGETLSKIAAKYGTSTSRLCEWNGLRSANRIHVGQRLVVYSSRPASTTRTASSGGGSGTHVVRSGDTLSGIARSYGLSLSSLRAMNGLGTTSTIRPGQRLAVSSNAAASRKTSSGTKTASAAKRSHTVRSGETLSAIARRYNCSIENLCAWNDIRKSEAIHPGDRLTIK